MVYGFQEYRDNTTCKIDLLWLIYSEKTNDTMSELNYRHLYYFYRIAREGSIVAASRKLHITQSTLSDQLKQLEEYLGAKLFDRKPRKLELNSTGKLTMQYAVDIFSKSAEMELVVRANAQEKTSLLCVGVIPSLPRNHIYDFLVPLWKSRKYIIVVKEARLESLIAALQISDMDVILSDAQHKDHNFDFRSTKLISQQIIAVASPKMNHLTNNFPKSLDGAPYISFTEHSRLRPEIDTFFKRHKIFPRTIGEVDDVQLASIAAENGLGFAILPQRAVATALKTKKLIKLGKPIGLNSDMWAITNGAPDKKGPLGKTIEQFSSKIKSNAKQR